jgi:hypothetical protein
MLSRPDVDMHETDLLGSRFRGSSGILNQLLGELLWSMSRVILQIAISIPQNFLIKVLS